MRRSVWVALLACVGVLEGHAQQDSDADTKSKIVAMEHIWAAAFRDKDPKALDRILDERFVCVSSDGRLFTKAEILADVASSEIVQLQMDSMAVRLHGDTAIITGIFRTSGVTHGKQFARRERFVDTWIYQDRRWITISSLVTPTSE